MTSHKSSISQRLVQKVLQQTRVGRLKITLPDSQEFIFGGKSQGPQAVIHVLHPEFFSRLVRHGDIGFGEAYTDGLWDTPDLVSVIEFFLHNKPALSPLRALGFPVWIERPLLRIKRFSSNRNTIKGCKKNIQAHYDLSNELFKTFLDPTMIYSAAVFADPAKPSETLEQAQRHKLRIMATKAGIRPGMNVLEIGCGWGGFAVLAAQEFGCHVTALTISESQYRYARDLVQSLRLGSSVDVRLADYRTLNGRFDAIVSIEMLEAVGHEFHPEFAKCLSRLLTPQGKAALQVITIHDQRYDAYRSEGDWINKHIFPGGLLPSLTRLCHVFTRHTDLRLLHVENIGAHYVPTLAAWRDSFLKAWPEIQALGFKECFRKTWEYYFSVCEAAFSTGHIDNLQIVLGRPPCDSHWCKLS